MRKRKRMTWGAGVALVLAGAACAAGDSSGGGAVIARLPAGTHIGMIEGFDDLSGGWFGTDRRPAAEALREQAIAAGMTIGRAQVDWRDLETAPGVYDEEALDESIRYAARGGMAVFVTFSTIDTFELTIPDYLTGEDGMAKDGLRLDGPGITARYNAFLDWFIPELAERGVWGLAMGNEVDGMINDGVLSRDEVLGHLLGGVRHARRLDPDLALTVTLTGDANLNLPRFTDALVAGLDLVSFNTYCLGSETLTVNSPADWAAVTRRWKATAGDKPIFIQELGCPSGFGHPGGGPLAERANGIGGSPELQARFFAYYMDAFARDPQLRAATVFQLFDWSPELSGIYNELFEEAGEPLAGARLEEWLATVGLCRWHDTSCRPAWDVWIDGLERIRSAR